jgi:hypothetical protein
MTATSTSGFRKEPPPTSGMEAAYAKLAQLRAEQEAARRGEVAKAADEPQTSDLVAVFNARGELIGAAPIGKLVRFAEVPDTSGGLSPSSPQDLEPAPSATVGTPAAGGTR